MNPRSYEPTPARRVAFLGLGVMGRPMAGHLARAGHHVTVYNRSAAKAAAWVAEYGGASAPTPIEMVRTTRMSMTMSSTSAATVTANPERHR